MREHTLARLQAKIYIKRNFKNLFGLYMFCQISYSAVYIILCVVASFLSKDDNSLVFIKTIIPVVSTLISAPVIFGFLERYKQKHFPSRYNFTQPIFSSIFLGIVISLFSLVNFVALSGTWQFLVMVVSFIGIGIFAPFFVYNLLTKEATIKDQLISTRDLIRETGLTYFINFLAFIPLGFLAAAIITLPTYAMQVNAVLSGFSPLLSLAVEEAAKVVFTVVAVIPVYFELKLFLSIYFLFSQGEPDFDFKEYL